jgi:bifunctional non-homologous end joining protein LigD
MPLERYRQKRNFAATPEPHGEAAPRVAAGGRFVVQRHRATRLHWDFRLEMGGVLASWAVPRGPSLDPDVRRMAVHVEDHPLEYIDFEGVIPARQYGAGDVIVWDWGTYEPEAMTPDPIAAIAAGELKFVIHGQKLKGRFTLVRTDGGSRGRAARKVHREGEADGDGESWLLIHKRDEFAVAGWDAEQFPDSVKTGRTNDDVRASRDALWLSQAPAAHAEVDLSGATPAPMPRFIEPMKATLSDRAFSNPDWLFEVKWDGYRIETVVDHGTVHLWTRNQHDGHTYFPGFLEPPSWIDAQQAIVDGEVVALDPDGHPDFGLLQERIGSARRAPDPGRTPAPLVYQVFDLLYLDGRLLTGVPLEQRKQLLRSVLRDQPRVRYASHVEGDGLAFFDAAAAMGLEGMVAKHRRSRYEPGRRTDTWLKIKARPEQEFVVAGFLPGAGTHAELGALVVGTYQDGHLRYAGRVGSGIDTRTRRSLRERLDSLQQASSPFDPPVPATGELHAVRWAQPVIVIRAEFANWTAENLLRQASFTGIEPDRDPRSVVRESAVSADVAMQRAARDEERNGSVRARPVARPPDGAARPKAAPPRAMSAPQAASSAEVAELDGLPGDATWGVGGRELRLTNLDKVLFPPRDDDPRPVTKRDLVRYFALVAPAMLPHLADRPLNLHRFPNGSERPGFWQKNLAAAQAPSWLRVWRETETGDSREPNAHVVADQVATLCWLGNLAAFEIHAWTASLADPASPTYALIDIDPGTRTTWDDVLTLARLYRTALRHLSIRGYPKVTGRRGIQVWIPVVPGYSYRETSDWVEGVSRAVGAAVPDLVSWEWAVARRDGRARLDYTQNASIKTLVAPYSVRPAPGAPVSAPITWDELDDPALRPDRWTIRTVIPRLAARGDLFAGAATDHQRLPRL